MAEPDGVASDEVIRRNWEAIGAVERSLGATDTGFEERIRAVLRTLTERSGYPVAYLTHIDDATQTFQIVSDTVGIDSVAEGTSTDLSKGYCRYTVADEPELTVLRAGDEISRDDPAYRTFGFELYVGVPLWVNGNLYGTLCLAGVDPDMSPPSSAEKSLLELTATRLGAELDRMEHERIAAVQTRVLRHNLRNSLTIVRGFVADLSSLTCETPHLETVLEELDTLIELGRKSREIERVIRNRTTLERIDVVYLIEEVLADIRRREPGADLELTATESPDVAAVPELRFAVEELIENAIQHADQLSPTVRIAVDSGPTKVTIRVRDDGPGIAEQEIARLQGPLEFDPIRHGSGLGLWLVRQIVQQSNGSLSFETEHTDGTTVEIALSRPSED